MEKPEIGSVWSKIAFLALAGVITSKARVGVVVGGMSVMAGIEDIGDGIIVAPDKTLVAGMDGSVSA